MLARSRLAWEAAAAAAAVAGGGGRCGIGACSYTTEASTAQSRRMRPQIERAIRLKSQEQRRAARQEHEKGTFRSRHREQGQSSRTFPARQDHRRYDSRQSYNPPDARLWSDVHGRMSPSRPFRERQAPRPFQARQEFRYGEAKRTSLGYERRSQPQRINSEYNNRPRESSRSEESGSIRETRFELARKLNSIVKTGRGTPGAAFAEAQELFDSVSGFAKREARIYNAMIRLAMRAGKRQWAIKTVNEMKKNGVAPSAVTYRSIFEGLSISKVDFSKETVLVQRIHDLYQELETIWIRVNTSGGREEHNVFDVDEERGAGTSTARSFAATKKAMEQDLLEYPGAFDMACLYYFVFLMSLKAYDQAAVLLQKADELVFLSTNKSGASSLSFLLSSRFLYELLSADLDPESQIKLRESVETAYLTVIAALRQNKNLFAEHSEPTEKSVVDRNTERREVDRALCTALSTLVKFDIPNRDQLVATSLEEIYDSKHLASLPPITLETTIRAALTNIKRSPHLVLRIFESALDYNDSVAGRFDDRVLLGGQVNVNTKDVVYCWTIAWFTAIMELKDLTKAMDLVQRAATMRKVKGETSRLTPPRMPRLYIFSHLMRFCLEKQEWNSALRVWRLFFDEVTPADRSGDAPSLERFIHYFLTFAFKMDKIAKDLDGAVVKHCRTALELLEKDFGLNNAALWERSERIIRRQPSPKSQSTSEGTEKEDAEALAFSIDYINTIRLVCRTALCTGEQGIDLAEKEQVEKWKDLRKRAAQLRGLGEGTDFDEAEADWLRSGVKGKTSLALSDEDMRELMG